MTYSLAWPTRANLLKGAKKGQSLLLTLIQHLMATNSMVATDAKMSNCRQRGLRLRIHNARLRTPKVFANEQPPLQRALQLARLPLQFEVCVV